MKAPHLLWEQISLAAPVVFMDREAGHAQGDSAPCWQLLSSGRLALRLLSENSGVWGSSSALSCVRRFFLELEK